MAADKTDLTFLPSILDRLVDPASQGTSQRPWYGLREMTAAIGRDLDALLNTRKTDQGLFDDYDELKSSLLSYGFPDIVSAAASSLTEIQRLGQAIKQAIERTEPRVCNVRVVPVEPDVQERRSVRFRVEGALRVPEAPDIAFTTMVELVTGHQTVRAVES